MIVVDTNTIAYLYLPAPQAAHVERLLELESIWAAPRLWRSEFRNILALYMRKEILDFETACQIQRQAESTMDGNEYEVDSMSVLRVATTSGCSAYDSEFIALAQRLETKLITSDKRLLKAFPDITATAKDFAHSA